ncbi:PrgI family protein [Microbacteriaceae bacterium]|nr:PrgI family protein [Candidatus Saccharibacteria bacterium]
MAVYKVAQDVEADDKLIGPFSFRQFIYLIIVAISIALAWGLSRLFVGLAIIPLPIIVFFGALALPLRKDQPMEIYLAAIVSFHLKPHRRLWIPDGIESLIEITTPKFVEVQRIKDLSQGEAEKRLSYLADIADTGGWAIRHSVDPFVGSTPLATDAFYAAQQTVDVLGEESGIAHSFEAMISQADQRRKQDMIARMHQPTTPAPAQPVFSQPAQQQSSPPITPQNTADPTVIFDPYPTEIHQMVINPIGSVLLAQPAPAKAPEKPIVDTPITTSEKPTSPDIINLASNPDLSIETIQREAGRIQHKQDLDDGEEVVITLR